MSYKPWYPKMKTGFFYVGDAAFYLYADKRLRTIQEATFYQWQLSRYPAAILELLIDSKAVSVNDVKFDKDFVLVRSTLFDPGDTLEIKYTSKAVSSGSIEQTSFTVGLDPDDAQTRYFLDPVPAAGGPIIFTDDSVDASEGESHVEFDVDEDTGEVTFHGSVPSSGTFEYEGAVAEYATVPVDLNPANTGRVTGLLSVGLDTTPGIDPELY